MIGHLETLIDLLTRESPAYRDLYLQTVRADCTEEQVWRIARALMNLRPPKELSPELLEAQNAVLREQSTRRKTYTLEDAQAAGQGLHLWRGDITHMQVTGIVNAANSQMLGCFQPNHRCIDNAIHTYAGMELRAECARLMKRNRQPEPAGGARVTGAYRLPSKYVIHTVGPIVHTELTQRHRQTLAQSYRSVLRASVEYSMETLALCCVSTGEFGFPQEEAARIAVRTVREEMTRRRAEGGQVPQVIFNVFTERDEEIYRRELGLL